MHCGFKRRLHWLFVICFFSLMMFGASVAIGESFSISKEMPIELYVREGCPYCERVELALSLSGLPYTKYDAKDLVKNDWMKTDTPRQAYPMVRIGEVTLFESLVIVDFIAAIQTSNTPQTTQRILPGSALEQAKQRAWGQWLGGFQNISAKLLVARDRYERAKIIAELESQLAKIQPWLDESGYLFGAQFGYAELVIAPLFLRLAQIDGQITLDLFTTKPELQRWYQTVLNSPVIQKVYDADWQSSYQSTIDAALRY